MGQPNKINGSTPSLDVRISATLASGDVDKTALVSLLAEAHEALSMAQNVIVAETTRLHDLSNEDPNASLDLINRSKLRVARLELAIPKLRDRIKAIELFEYREAWHTEADAVEARGSKSAERLKHYAKFITWLEAEFNEIDDINSEIHALHARAPYGENRRLIEPELVARDLTNYDAKHPRLREQLKLPDFVRADTIAFPMDPMAEFNRRAAQQNEALTKRMKDKYGFVTGDNWAAGRDLAVQQEEAEHAKKGEELKKQELESKRKYEEGLKHD
jgi:hypothetical protein